MAHAGEERGLVLAGLSQLPVLVLDFVEQPYVLNGDDGLVGKSGSEFDLSVSVDAPSGASAQ
jgi:hypothetical protein